MHHGSNARKRVIESDLRFSNMPVETDAAAFPEDMANTFKAIFTVKGAFAAERAGQLVDAVTRLAKKRKRKGVQSCGKRDETEKLIKRGSEAAVGTDTQAVIQ